MPLCTPGSWLYRRASLSWLSDPALIRQLPRLYRLFACYCAAPGYHPIGAEALLRGVIAMERLTSLRDGIIPLHIGEFNVFLDLWDPRFLRIPLELSETPRLLNYFLKPGDTFIDAGANHGTFSIVAAGLVGTEGLVVAIEPQPRLAGLLRKLLAQGPSRFQVHQMACGQYSRDAADFYIPAATSGSASLFPDYSARCHHRSIQVATRTLDELIDWRRLTGRTFIKLDIEGSELSCLLGARQLIRAAAPTLMLEINPSAMRGAATTKTALVETLLHLGYERFVTPDQLELPRSLTNEVQNGDVIVLPESPKPSGRAHCL